MRIPTEEEINIHGTGYEQSAVTDYIGKTFEEVELKYREDGVRYQYLSDLAYMGPFAFQYYLHALVNYLMSPESAEDHSALVTLHHLMRHRMDDLDHQTGLPLAKMVIEYVLRERDKFRIEGSSDQGPHELGFPELLARLKALSSE